MFIIKKTQQGFTLIEMVVSIAIFIVVAVVATVALLQVVNANKKAQSIKTAVNNINYALESMTRELRVGTNYNCYPGQSAVRPTTLSGVTACDAQNGNWTLAFLSSKSDVDNDNSSVSCKLIHTYYFNGTSLYKGEQADCGDAYTIYPIIFGTTNTSDARLNESNITFTAGTVRVVTGTDRQPYIQFQFSGTSGSKEKLKSDFDVRTTVSQRLPQL
jgi:prepilin-type N-terminal cleavage/methylation domain-containing protein